MNVHIKARCIMIQQEPYAVIKFNNDNGLIISYYPTDARDTGEFNLNKYYEITIKEEVQNEN